MGEASSVQRPSMMSSGVRRKGLSNAASETRRQNCSSRLGAVRAAFGVAADEDGGVHGAGGGAGNAFDLEARFVQEPVEDFPGEAPCAPPPWRRQVHEQGRAVAFRGGFPRGTPYFSPD